MKKTEQSCLSLYARDARRVGILGGSFDPIHYGHLTIAEAVHQHFQMDQTLLIPAALQPFKMDKKVTPPPIRLKMTQYAAEEYPQFSVSPIELERTGPSYTMDTIRELKAIYGPDTEFFFILGADAFSQIDKWHEAEELLHSCSFVLFPRQGYSEDEPDAMIERIRAMYADVSVFYLPVKAPSVSSTQIRKLAAEGKSIHGLLPARVEEFILENGLYQTEETETGEPR